MFSLVKEKLLSVQEGIASSLKGGEAVQTSRKDYNAGAKLLAKYQANWEEIHSLLEANAKQASVIDKQIEKVYESVKHQRLVIKKFNYDINDLGAVTVSTEKAVNAIGNIRSMIDEIQRELISLEELIEEEEHQVRMDEARGNLKEFRREQLISLDALRERLAEDYEDKVNGREGGTEVTQRKNYERAEKKFQRDITIFKETGELPKSEPAQATMKIEEVEIDQDLESLQEYLQT